MKNALSYINATPNRGGNALAFNVHQGVCNTGQHATLSGEEIAIVQKVV